MDFISLALTLSEEIRFVLSAMEGETKLVVTCRALLHATSLYSECLSSLQKVCSNQPLINTSPKIKASLDKVRDLIGKDINLLQKIKEEVDGISKTKATKGFLQNVIISQWTGRIHTIHKLEGELMNRFQIITAIMMKDVYQSSQGFDEATMQMIGDVDGCVFWHSNFGQAKNTTFKVFLSAYQDYLSKVLFCRRLPLEHLQTLLSSTLMDEASSRLVGNDLALKPVTVNMFGQWLTRFGPLRQTLTKASALTIPSTDLPVQWFRSDANREQAVALIEKKLQCTNGRAMPHQLIILRYSSDPKNHFVITCKHLNSGNVDHYAVCNGVDGYYIARDEQHCYPNLVECIQNTVVNTLYAAVQATGYEFPRDSLDQWETIISCSTMPLPANHYGDRKALEKCSDEALFGVESLSSVSYGFTTLAGGWDNFLPLENGSSKTLAGAWDNFPPLENENGKSLHQVQESTKLPANRLVSDDEELIGGKYMVKHGVKLLLTKGFLDEYQANQILSIVNKV
eukprot:gene5046-5540_t